MNRVTELTQEAYDRVGDPRDPNSSGAIRAIVEQAVADNPSATLKDVLEIEREARAEWADELAREAQG